MGMGRFDVVIVDGNAAILDAKSSSKDVIVVIFHSKSASLDVIDDIFCPKSSSRKTSMTYF